MQGSLLSTQFYKVVMVANYPLFPTGHGKLRVFNTYEDHLTWAVWIVHSVISSHGHSECYCGPQTGTLVQKVLADAFLFILLRKAHWRFTPWSPTPCFQAASVPKELLKVVERRLLQSVLNYWVWHSVLSWSALGKLSPLLVSALLHPIKCLPSLFLRDFKYRAGVWIRAEGEVLLLLLVEI